MTPPVPPPRTSSLKEWSEERIKIQQSQADLKRKMSQTLVEEAPIAYQKLKIQHLESLEIEQINLKAFYDMEHKKDLLTDDAYETAHRKTRKRVISLGKELWQANQGLRSLEEQAGLHPTLGADYDGAFAAVLLKLYKDPTEKSNFRRDAIAKYQSDKKTKKKWLHCPITNTAHPQDYMKATHIVPTHLGPEIVEYLFGPGGGSRLYSADNSLLSYDRLEPHLNKGHFFLLPVDNKEVPITRWKVQITNDDAGASSIDDTPLRDFQGRELVFRNDARPASRFLYFHFVVALLRNAHYKFRNHLNYSRTLPAGKPFATMGPYMRRSMLYALTRKAGHINTEFQELIENMEETTFDDKNNLTDEEEAEIARRVLDSRDGDESDDDDDELESEREGKSDDDSDGDDDDEEGGGDATG